MRLQIKNKVISWLVTDLFLPNKRVFLVSFFLVMLATGTKVGAYALLFKYVNSLESEEPFSLLSLNIDANTSYYFLLVIAVLTGSLLLISSLLDYWSTLILIRLSDTYNRFCSSRILSSLREFQASNEQVEFHSVELRKIRRAIIKDSRFCAKSVNLFSKSIKTTTMLFVSLFIMFRIHGLLTIVIIAILIPLSLALKAHGKKIARETKAREIQLLKFIGEVKSAINDQLNRISSSSSEIDEDKIGGPETSLFYDLYYGVSKKSAFSSVILATFMAVLTIIIILISGNLVLFGVMNWAVFIAFMVALRFFLNSVGGLEGVTKRAGNVYHYISHYTMILHSLDGTGINSLSQINDGIGKSIGIVGEDDSLQPEDDDDDDDDDF